MYSPSATARPSRMEVHGDTAMLERVYGKKALAAG